MQNNPSTVHRIKVSRELILPTMKPSFDEVPTASVQPNELTTEDVQKLKEILIAKEMEICLLKK